MRFYAEKTSHSPLIQFENGVLVIAGRSIPENSLLIYDPLFNFINRYSDEFKAIEIHIKLEYANSSTNRSLMTLFEMMEEITKKGCSVKVNWYYQVNDKEMLDLGSDFKDIVPLLFEVFEVETLD